MNDEAIESDPPVRARLMYRRLDDANRKRLANTIQVERIAGRSFVLEQLDADGNELHIDADLLQRVTEVDDALPIDARNLNVRRSEIDQPHPVKIRTGTSVSIAHSVRN